MGAEPVIPPKRNRKEQREYDTGLYKERHLVECFFNKLKHYRRCFSRFDKFAELGPAVPGGTSYGRRAKCPERGIARSRPCSSLKPFLQGNPKERPYLSGLTVVQVQVRGGMKSSPLSVARFVEEENRR